MIGALTLEGDRETARLARFVIARNQNCNQQRAVLALHTFPLEIELARELITNSYISFEAINILISILLALTFL